MIILIILDLKVIKKFTKLEVVFGEFLFINVHIVLCTAYGFDELTKIFFGKLEALSCFFEP